MRRVRNLSALLLLWAGTCQAADPQGQDSGQQSGSFADAIETELGGNDTKTSGDKGKAESTAAPQPDVNVEGWTVDGFLKSLNRADIKPNTTPESSATIKDAVKRSVKKTSPNSYLDAVTDEANDVSLKPLESGNIGDNPTISRVVHGENLVEIGGRVIKNGFLVVQPGDSLSIIAGDIYGNQQAYNRIFEANQKLLSDPNMLQAGESIFIPIE